MAELAIALLPFAPRRARVSAERSTQVIRAAGLSSPDLKFPTSVYPPSFSALAVSPSVSSLQPPSLPAVSRDAPTVMDVEAALDDAPAPRRRAWVAWLAAAAVVAVASVVWTRTRAAVASDGSVAVEAARPAEPDSPRETASAAFDRGAPAEEELEILPPQAASLEAKSAGSPRLAVATSTATAAANALAMTSTATPRRPDARTRPNADAGSAIDVASAEDPDLGY